MPKPIGVLVAATVFLGLTACAPPRPGAAAAPLLSADITPVPTASAAVTPSPIAPTFVQASPTAEPTAQIPELQDGAIRSQIDKLASWFVDQGTDPGLSVSVVMRNPQTGQLEEMLLSYGRSSKDKGQPITPDTIYEIGSITKVFTGILLGEAVNSGAMKLSDPIQMYLPPGIQAPAYNDVQITLLDLATHRSGLPRDLDSDGIADMYAWLNSLHISRLPGSEYSYSNAGYSLLGDMLARQAGTDYGSLEYTAVSRPLGLSDTTEALNTVQASRLAQGYTYDGSPADDFPQSGAMSGAGYLHSTLADMTRFLVENMQPDATPLGRPIDMTESLQAGGRNPGTGVGLGWEIDGLGTARERLYKGGATRAFTSYISFTRDGRAGFVLLANGMFVENLVPHMLNILGMNQ